jgi:hypothetical protein
MLCPTKRTRLQLFQNVGIIAGRINRLLSYKLRAENRDQAGSMATSYAEGHKFKPVILTDRFCILPHCLQENTGMVSQIMP